MRFTRACRRRCRRRTRRSRPPPSTRAVSRSRSGERPLPIQFLEAGRTAAAAVANIVPPDRGRRRRNDARRQSGDGRRHRLADRRRVRVLTNHHVINNRAPGQMAGAADFKSQGLAATGDLRLRFPGRHRRDLHGRVVRRVRRDARLRAAPAGLGAEAQGAQGAAETVRRLPAEAGRAEHHPAPGRALEADCRAQQPGARRDGRHAALFHRHQRGIPPARR